MKRMFVALSQFAVANGMDHDVRRAFVERPHLVDSASGFIRMDVISPVEAAEEFWLITYWETETDFQAWHRSDSHRASHKFIPRGLRLDPARTVQRAFHHVAS